MTPVRRTAPVFNFIIDSSGEELERCSSASDLTTLFEADPGMLARLSSRGDLCWCLQSFLVLKAQGNLRVMCSDGIRKGCINIAHSDHLLDLKGKASEFLVCVRADYPRRRWAHYHLVQNKAQCGADTSYIPLWIQPGLIKRDDRRSGVRTVAYAGEVTNGNLAGKVDAWEGRFAGHGLQFVRLPRGGWHDLSGIDVLIGIRSFDSRRYDGKPPSKILNAWHAGIPFVGGSDSAFAQVATPGEDYLLATSPDAVVDSVLALRADAGLYARLVRNGASKVGQYSQDAVAAIWEQVLLGPVLRRFERWRSSPAYEAAMFELKLGLGLLEHGSKQVIKRAIGTIRAPPSVRIDGSSL